MLTSAAVHQSKGLDHQVYEDRYRLLGGAVPLVERSGRGHLFAVMDGVGAAPRGMNAAQHGADRLTDFYREPSVPATKRGLLAHLVAVSDEIHAWGMMEGTDRPVGAAAATVAWFSPSRELVLSHAGDTVAFRFTDERLIKLTHDHTAGRGITRYFGQHRLAVEQEVVQFEEGDLLCLVTDGVYPKGMREDGISAVLRAVRDPERAVRELGERARGRGSRDDITVLVVELEEW